MNNNETSFGDVLVVGGGISGIQAALDLATTGFRIYLVDRAPTIGGKMAQLDKTFPTNDCSMCIESPKFIECDRHPNIEILTYTEVDSVAGRAGDFEVVLTRKPRYIREDICTGCTTCVEYCPVMIPDPFNQELSDNKAVHIYFSQAVPLVPYIDEECLFLKEEKCSICEGVCKNGAIDLHQKAEKQVLKVGAIVLSPGYDAFDPGARGDYGYGVIENVVTSLDFERLLCATGPHEGEILRPSDKKHPRRIAWIHCVGSRQVLEGGHGYCSSVCCSYIQKQVILAKDHDTDTEAVIFHNDIRSYNKDFERFYKRAENLPGVEFVRSYVEIGREIPETKNVTIRYATDADGVKEEEFDLVVLGVGLAPPAGAVDLAAKFGIELDDHGFCLTDPVNPIETSRPGVFTSGAFTGPMDIPEAVAAASGACAGTGTLLRMRRGRLARERVYPEERDVSGEEAKVGVFACHCGANIGRVVDVPGLVEYSKTLDNVAHAEEGLFICSTDAAAQIAKTIREKGLNRVVVAACTPRTHEPLFRDTLREGGINQYFFDMANIREHCSWVHSKQKEEATAKARDIVRMSVARSIHLEPLTEFELPVNKAALVVGGGPAGMTAALSLAGQGFVAHLVEKETELGGMARRIRTTLEGLDVQAYVGDLVRRVYKHPLVHVIHGATITDVSGYVGSFATTVESEGRVRTIEHGAAILATGADEHRPGEYLYGEDDRVLTQLELEEHLAAATEQEPVTESVAATGDTRAVAGAGSTAATGDTRAVAGAGSTAATGDTRVVAGAGSAAVTAAEGAAAPGEDAATARDESVAAEDETPAQAGREWPAAAGTVVMIQCVGCREEGRDYCARICCGQAVKNALALREANPGIDVYILYRDMRTYGFKEDYYRDAAEKGVRFVRWEPDGKPVVEAAKGETGDPVLRVTVADPVLGQRLAIDAGLVVLSAAAVPSAGGRDAARLFKTAANPDGFAQEAHVKLRPVDFAADGVFLCGAGHYPKHLSEAITQAYGAAGRAATLLSQNTVTASGAVCEVNENECVSCGACISACAYGAVSWRETPAGRKAEVNPVLCKGDGLCCSKCPTDAISLKHFTNEEIFSQIDAALSESWASGGGKPGNSAPGGNGRGTPKKTGVPA